MKSFLFIHKLFPYEKIILFYSTLTVFYVSKTYAQSTVFAVALGVSYGNLTPEQKSVYDKLIPNDVPEGMNILLATYDENAINEPNGFLKLSIGELGIDTLNFKAKFVEYENNQNFSWSGDNFDLLSTAAYPSINLSFVRSEGFIVGSMMIGSRSFRIEDLGDGIILFIERNVLLSDPTGETGFEGEGSFGQEFDIAAPLLPGGVNWCGKDSLKILFIFSNGSSEMVPNDGAYVKNCMATFNRTLSNSLAHRKAYLAGYATVNLDDYPISSFANPYYSLENLNKLASFMDFNAYPQVQNLRTSLKADVICFVTSSLARAAGIAAAIGSNFESAYVAIVPYAGTKSDGQNFAHEMGHILGGRHESDNTNGIINYNRGYQFSVGNATYNTIVTNSPLGTTIDYYSNPNQSYLNHATGDAIHRNNTRRIKEWWPQTAGYFTDMGPFYVGVNIAGTVPWACQSQGTATVEFGQDCSFGPYTYEWSYSDNGIDWATIANSNSQSISTTVLPNSFASPASLYNVRMYKAKVTSIPYGYVAYAIGNAAYSCMGVAQSISQKTTYKAAQDITFEVFPNPSKSNKAFSMRYSLPNDELLTMDLYDLSGRKIKTIYQGTLGAGNHKLSIKSDLINSGSYQIVIKGASWTKTIKFIIN